ncbi:hypothetical protein D026_1214 [Vibrio parahaemolyticus 605]|nr:hypothetical protein D035_3348 [Vibrio parahaemolyticus VP250]EQM03671.1 hypothetical protein D036_1379 [Vibrio parahaemolyticus VP232]EQM09125.1 hypothetical protein D045_1075 [Vibrio parahaemolyticus VP-NY4]ETT12214.1 hypothetical protein D026_1214 [Vibrio parahaemolyticus 605]ETY19491.1 hypothetical protein D039_2056 [Vibrio parahaemolyticus EKP-028]
MLTRERIDVISEHINGFTEPEIQRDVARFHNVSLLQVCDCENRALLE